MVMRASGKRSGESRDRLHLFSAGAHAALQLEIAKSIAGLRRLGEPDDGRRRSTPLRGAAAASHPRASGSAR